MTTAKDSVLEEELDRALAPYKDLLPKEALAEMREMLAIALTTHPVGSELLSQVTPRPVVKESGDLEKHEDGTFTKPQDHKDKAKAGGQS